MASTPESKVKKTIKKWLTERGIWFYMPVSSGMGVHGIPDFICCWNGRFLSIECKAPGKRGNVSELQKERGKEIQAAGGIWLVVDDVSQLVTWWDEMHNVHAL